jgi:hypothetical protein
MRTRSVEQADSQGVRNMSEIHKLASGDRIVIRLAEQSRTSEDPLPEAAADNAPGFSFVKVPIAECGNLYEDRDKNRPHYAFDALQHQSDLDALHGDNSRILGLVQHSLAQINRSRRLVEWSLWVLLGLFFLYLITMLSIFV